MDSDYLYCYHGSVEKILNEKFKVHHLYRDFRHDWADDSGYVVAISQLNDIFYLHIITVNYESKIENLCLTIDDLESKGGFPDYIRCTSIEDAQQQLLNIIRLVDLVLELNDGDHPCDTEEIISILEDENISTTQAEHILAIAFPYSEYPQDKVALTNLSKLPYKPNFSNEDPFTTKLS